MRMAEAHRPLAGAYIRLILCALLRLMKRMLLYVCAAMNTERPFQTRLKEIQSALSSISINALMRDCILF